MFPNWSTEGTATTGDPGPSRHAAFFGLSEGFDILRRITDSASSCE